MSKKLWGGRFEKATDPLVEKFTQSIQFDNKLAEFDIVGSLIHIKILEKNNYLTREEASSLKKELKNILISAVKHELKFDDKAEDIHTNIQNILQNKLGDVALKLHMARSRNDQVVFATKAYCKFAINWLLQDITKLIEAIDILIKNNDFIIPGFTHMQHAQPIYLKDYLRAYSLMLKKDSDRLNSMHKDIKITMGSGALAGTPINASEYNKTAREVLEKDEDLSGLKEIFGIEVGPNNNSIYTVSDRDFIIEILSILSIIAMHLSRIAEDLIIWSTKEFDFVEIDESFCTGSSLMPQKKNPDVLELIRGYAGRVYGNLISVLVMMKGLPLTYNRDMQLDKEPLFNSFKIVSSELKVLEGLLKTLKFNKDIIDKQLKDEELYATDLVYYLVQRQEPFEKAHTIVGELVKYSIANKIAIKEIPEDILKEKFSDKFVKSEIAELFDSKRSVESKKSIKRE